MLGTKSKQRNATIANASRRHREQSIANETRQSQMPREDIVHKVSDRDNCNNCQMHRNDIDCHRGLPWHLLLEFFNVEQSDRRHRATTRPPKGSPRETKTIEKRPGREARERELIPDPFASLPGLSPGPFFDGFCFSWGSFWGPGCTAKVTSTKLFEI